MQNIKYHMLNITAILVFAYTSAFTLNQIIEFNLSPVLKSNYSKKNSSGVRTVRKNLDYYSRIVDSGFFMIAEAAPDVESGMGMTPDTDISNLRLLGTITGPASIARALIQKKGDKYPGIFALWKINTDITNDVFGYKLKRILDDKVIVERNGTKSVIELFAEEKSSSSSSITSRTSPGGNLIKKNISRAEIQQKVLNNMDNAMKGLVAGPYRENGKIVGYRLKKVRSYNILYKLGARSGDIIKRINGKSLDSIEKLYSMWGNLKNETGIKVDLERRGQTMTFDFNISE